MPLGQEVDASMHALSQALGTKKKRGATVLDFAQRPLPELPQPELPPSTPPALVPSPSKQIRLTELPPPISSFKRSHPGHAIPERIPATSTSEGTASQPPQSQSKKSPYTASARASALRSSLLNGSQKRHAAPGPPPPRKVMEKLEHAGLERRSLSRLAMYFDDDMPGEVQRGKDGSRLSVLQVIDNDGFNQETLDPEMLKAQREEFLLQHRAVDAASVPELHKRLVQRREVMATLTAWTTGVLRKQGLELGDDEHLDAEQMEEESKLSSTGGMGVGATLRAYWNATVQDEVELRFNTMRIAWEKEAAADMAELKELRDKGKKLKAELDSTKQQLAGMNIKYEVAQKQVISAQRSATKQAAAAAEAEAPKQSAGQQALGEATIVQLKSDLNEVKAQLDRANAKIELHQGEALKTEHELEGVRAECASLMHKLQEAQAKMSQRPEEPEPPSKGESTHPPQKAPAPDSGSAAEGQKVKKDLDKLQIEHAKLQMSLKAKMNEVDKLTKELKEARMKSPTRSSPSASVGRSASSTPLTKPSSGRKPGKPASDKGDPKPTPGARDPSDHIEHESSAAAYHRDSSGERGIETRRAGGGEDLRAGSPGGASSYGDDGAGVEGEMSGPGLMQEEIKGSGEGGKRGGRAHLRTGSKVGKQGGLGSRSNTPDPSSQARISSLEGTVAKLTEQLEQAKEKLANRENFAGLSTLKSGGTKLARSDAELKVAEAKIKDLQVLVDQLQKDLKAMKERSSIHQQELAIEVELNKRVRLLRKLRQGTEKVEAMLHMTRDRAGDGRHRNSGEEVEANIEAGAKELVALVQALEAEFGQATSELCEKQNSARATRRSSMGHRLALDSEDLTSLLFSSTLNIQRLASLRASSSGVPALSGSIPEALLPPASTTAGREGQTRPSSAHTVAFQDDDGYREQEANHVSKGMPQRALVAHQDDDGHREQDASQGALQAGVPVNLAGAKPEHRNVWEEDEALHQLDSDPSGDLGVRFVPAPSQLPRDKGSSRGIGVSTVMGRQGPQVYGARPASARPALQLQASIEDATRWRGMFERLHASYLDPNGIWRVFTRRDGPTQRVDDLQPLLDGAYHAAQRAETSAKAAASAMEPLGGWTAGARSHRRGRASEATRRPQSAGPAAGGWQHPDKLQHAPHQQQQQLQALYNQQPGPHLHQQQPPMNPPQQHLPRSPRMQAASRSPSPTHAQQTTHTGLPHQMVGALGNGPPLLKHNLYQQQPDQPIGVYNIRMLTATPQKGIQLKTRPQSAHPNSYGQWSLGPGEGEPQSPPLPQPYVVSERLGNNIGLSVPSHSWTLQQPSFSPSMPAGGLLHAPGTSCPVYNGIEMMSRMELVQAVKGMEAYVKDIAIRYNRIVADKALGAQIQSELALEIAEAREHWVAENEYNSHLQDELERLHSILKRVAAEARLQEGSYKEDDAPHAQASPSPSAAETRAALRRAHQVKDVQEQHLSEAEAAAERMRLPSPTAIRAKFKHAHEEPRSVAEREEEDDLQLAPWEQTSLPES